MSPVRLALGLVLVCAVSGAAAQDAPRKPTPSASGEAAQAVERGRLATAGVCASCHAVGRTGVSPMADATPFREIVQRYPLDQLEEAFAEGLVTGHPAMPQFVFRAGEIDDLIAYLETLKTTDE